MSHRPDFQTNSDLARVAMLNPVPDAGVCEVTQLRAEARLAQILRTDPQAESALAPSPSSRRARRARWALLPATAALAIALFAQHTANPPAAWSAVPVPLTAQDVAGIDLNCEPAPGVQVGMGETGPTVTWAEAFRAPLIAERRGALALFFWDHLPGNNTGMCVYWDTGEAWVPIASGGGPNNGPVELSGSEVLLNTMMTVQQTVPLPTYPVGDDFTAVTGFVGPQVRELVIHAVGADVTASINNGWFAAIWPKRAQLSPDETLGYSVTTTDGAVIEVAQMPWHDSGDRSGARSGYTIGEQ